MTMMETPLIMRVLASSVCLAQHAGSIVRSVFASNDLGIIDKGINDLQSKADRDAQRCIVNSLTNRFPGLCVVGEEGALSGGKIPICVEEDAEVLSKVCPSELHSIKVDDLVVWVDPLDGTKEFTEGLVEHVTVLIGLAVGGRPVGGVIAQPFYLAKDQSKPAESMHGEQGDRITRVIWALEGLGVFGLKPCLPMGELPYPINPTATKGSVPHTVVVTRSHATANLKDVLDSFAPTTILRAGGCGYKVLMLLEGMAHVYVFPSAGCKKWDTCAPEAVLNAAGGRLTTILGDTYKYDRTVEHANKYGVLATPVASWLPAYANCVPQRVVKELKKTG